MDQFDDRGLSDGWSTENLLIAPEKSREYRAILLVQLPRLPRRMYCWM